MGRRHLILMALAAMSASCGERDRREEQPPVAPTPEPTPTAVAAASNGSIMRPSVVEEVEEAAPAPARPTEPIRMAIGFPDGGAQLDDQARTALDVLVSRPDFGALGAITLRGHSDSKGSDAANLRASLKRAEAVRDYLVEKGVAAARVTVVALGERRPVAPNADLDGADDEAGMRRNRRVEVEIAPVPSPTAAGEPDAASNTSAPTG